MSLVDKLKGLFGGKKGLPADLNSPDEIKQKLDNLLEQHGDTINKVADTTQEKIPGQADDKVIDSLQNKLNGQSPNDQPTQPSPQQ